MVSALNNLQKKGWTILTGLGENLEQIAILVVINKNFQLLKLK